MIPVDIVMIPTASPSPGPDGNGTESVGSLTDGSDSEENATAIASFFSLSPTSWWTPLPTMSPDASVAR